MQKTSPGAPSPDLGEEGAGVMEADWRMRPLTWRAPPSVFQAVCRTNGFYSLNVQNWYGLHKSVQPLVKRVCDTDRLACSKTCLNSADIGFVIDGSSSVGTGNFRTVLQFVANLSKEFDISDTDTRVGAVQYTYEQRLEFGFDQYTTKPDVLNAIKRVGYWSGGTSTGAAINYALEQLFKKSKPNKRKLMILITDGRSYDDVRIPAMVAHHKGEWAGPAAQPGAGRLPGVWWGLGPLHKVFRSLGKALAV